MKKTPRCNKAIAILALLIFSAWMAEASAPQPAFNIVKPSTTGVPGEEVRVMKFDPAGNLWIAGRFYFWGEAGLAMLSADQLDYQPLPGGGSIPARGRFGQACIIRFPRFTSTTLCSAPVV